MTGLWTIWMSAWCAGTGLFGLILALAGLPGLEGPCVFVLTVIGAGAEDLAAFEAPLFRFALAVMGAVTMGWALTIYGLLRACPGHGPLWRWATAAVSFWFVVDSTLSALTGFPGNAVPNLGLYAAFLVPVLASGVLRRPS